MINKKMLLTVLGGVLVVGGVLGARVAHAQTAMKGQAYHAGSKNHTSWHDSKPAEHHSKKHAAHSSDWHAGPQ